MVGLNQAVISGTVANEVNMAQTQAGCPVAHFTLVSERTGKNGVTKLYVPITAWGTVAEQARTLNYGGGVTVLGRLSLGRRKNRATGEEKVELEVIAEMLVMDDPQAQAAPQQGQQMQGQVPPQQQQKEYGRQYQQPPQRATQTGEYGARYVLDGGY